MNAARTVLAERQVRLTVEDYLLLDREGALAAYGRTELIDGAILPVSPQYLPHGHAKMQLIFALHEEIRALGLKLAVLSEVSVDMRPRSMPMPDVILARVVRGPGAIPVEAVALLAEVSSSTQDVDAGPKAALYAEQGVPEYWLIDIVTVRVTRMWAPGPDGYRERDQIALGERLTSASMPELSVNTAKLLQ
jgi:Uma2 family endonuclease